MILGTGIDILKISRIKEEHAKRILSDKEKEAYDQLKLDSRKKEFLAGRFAVKEALIKAIGHTSKRVGMRDITILNDESGMPYLVSPVYEDLSIHISLSHEDDYCVGLCVIENV
ncbi:MAG TPA: holo-ACP synthase [Bacillota bacterium]|nr:holo-ACP synthase [Bacillota bacterium]HPJ23379.1 holo-ACP synthase [Bacillota bacterium]